MLSSGERLAQALKIDKILRLKALPLSVSLPWGINLGAVDAETYAERVQATMQEALDELTEESSSPVGWHTALQLAGIVEMRQRP